MKREYNGRRGGGWRWENQRTPVFIFGKPRIIPSPGTLCKKYVFLFGPLLLKCTVHNVLAVV